MTSPGRIALAFSVPLAVSEIVSGWAVGHPTLGLIFGIAGGLSLYGYILNNECSYR